MLAVAIFNFPYQAVRNLIVALALVAVIVAAVVMTAIVVTALTPVIAGCCAATVGAMPQIAAVVGVFYFMWLIKP